MAYLRSDVPEGRAADHTPKTCSMCALKSTSTCAALAADALVQLESRRTRQLSIPARRIVLREGDKPAEMLRLFSGWAARLKVLACGRRQILSFVLPGDLLAHDLRADEPLHFSVVALTDVNVCAFSRLEIAAETKRNPALADAFANAWAAKARELERTVMSLGRLSAAGRIAGLVLQLQQQLCSRGLAEGMAFDLPLRHEDLADALGMTAPHLSRTLAVMRDEGLLEIGHGRVTIGNFEGLASLTN